MSPERTRSAKADTPRNLSVLWLCRTSCASERVGAWGQSPQIYCSGRVGFDPNFMDMVGSTVTNQPVPIEMDQRKRNYLHPVAGSAAAKGGAGLFAKPSA